MKEVVPHPTQEEASQCKHQTKHDVNDRDILLARNGAIRVQVTGVGDPRNIGRSRSSPRIGCYDVVHNPLTSHGGELDILDVTINQFGVAVLLERGGGEERLWKGGGGGGGGGEKSSVEK